MSKERLKFTTTLNNSLAPEITFLNHTKVKVKFDGPFLKWEKNIFPSRKHSKVFIVHKLNLWLNYLDKKFRLLNSLFAGVKLTRSFVLIMILDDQFRTFALSDGRGFDKNVIIFRCMY